ncbi:MAG: transcription-repair coupling factor [Phycisphaerales bacterium]|nr:transcription-repair coupling factor [Phycisphaerales bacterium]
MLAQRLAEGRETYARIPGGNASTVSVVVAAALQGIATRGARPCHPMEAIEQAKGGPFPGPPPQSPGREKSGPILLVTAHIDDADEAVDELRGLGVAARLFPALEVLPGETGVNPELLGQRLELVRLVIDGETPEVIVAPIHALMQAVPEAGRLGSLCLNLRVGQTQPTGELLAWLEAAGYLRVPALDGPGQFAVRGGLIDIYPAGRGDDTPPVRLDFFGDEIEAISEVDPDTLATDRRIDEVQIVGATVSALLSEEGGTLLTRHLRDDAIIILHELMEVTEQGRGYYERAISGGAVFGPPAVLADLRRFTYLQIDAHPVGATDPDATIDLPVESLPPFAEDAKEAVRELVELAAGHDRVVVLCNSEGERQRFRELVADAAPQGVGEIESVVSYLHRGFVWLSEGGQRLALTPYHELLHRYHIRRSTKRLRAGRALDAFLEIAPGDYVVHRDHGIARFVELATLRINRTDGRRNDNAPAREYLTLEFAGSTRLHVPLTRIDLVQKYVGGFDGKPPLSHMGGRKWTRQKEQVSEAVRDLAAEMLRIQAARQHVPGIRYPNDTAWQKQFEAEFPYDETPDQLAAIAEIKKDMHSDRPMDRLLCGDVGFGKTELAIRAAFKAAEYGKQVAILVPTTVLAEQHHQTFRQRFADYPFRVEVISRFQTAKQSKEIIRGLREGAVDVIIGTHRLLSKDVKFADLGLVVIDEEQRFGVEHKQRLLQFRLTADVLTLSATPIPRTLHMSMLGLRDISSLTTAPTDRRAVVTEVIPWNDRRLAQAISRELARQGQVFFVHNRVHNIKSIADQVQRMAPGARVLIGHGQMPDRELEEVMIKFIRHEADILVCTTIIESGIDIASANTMFINEATNFGLADLHQLRGRVGRSKHRAYCYLLLPRDKAVTSVAARRLRAIEEFSMLGAGFKIAMRDLEIRGAGNLLGAEQSGHIAAVGYEMYCHLLETAVKDLKREPDLRPVDTEIELDIEASIPRSYIPADLRRMEAYRRISQARSLEDLARVQSDLVDAYGTMPAAADMLFRLTEVRVLAAMAGVSALVRHESDLIFRAAGAGRLAEALQGVPGTVRLVDAGDAPAEVYYRPSDAASEPGTLLSVLKRRLQVFTEKAAVAV